MCVWQAVPTHDKEVIARLRNCILALADQNMMLYDTSVMYAYEASAHYQVEYCRWQNVMILERQNDLITIRVSRRTG